TKAFLTKAGTTIFCLSVILWAMSYYPRLPENLADAAKHRTVVLQVYRDRGGKPSPVLAGQGEKVTEDLSDNAVAAAQAESSISGLLGHFLEPLLRPLGFDWKMDVGLVS